MKSVLISVFVILGMTAGCITIAPAGESQLPTAYIDSIFPTEASLGETVSFVGHGTDPDGTVVAYRWRSDVDGDLGVAETLETSFLSVGTHVVYFKVQDNNGNWSDEVRDRVIVSAGASAAASAPVINSFTASPGNIAPGSSSTLSWSASGAVTVSIDQGIGNVALTGTRVVSPGATTTYTLTASNAAGSIPATAQVMVSGAAPPPSGGLPVINSFSAVPPIIDAGDSTSLSWNVSNATSVTIDQGVGPVASAGSTPVSPAATTSYTLTATNASGWSSVTIPVVVGAAPAAGEPDLVILDISRDGDTIHYTIKNQGLGVAGASTSALLVDGVVKGFDNVGSLAAGAESTESFGYSYTCSGLSDTIVVRADKDSVVDESSEANNEYSEGWICFVTPSPIIPPPVISPIIPTEHTVTLFSIVEEDGQVWEVGDTWGFPVCGDEDFGNWAIQAFLSFDISGIPAGAAIKSASLDLSISGKTGDPFEGLGSLRVYNDQYGNVDANDFTEGSPLGAIARYDSWPVEPFSFDVFGISKLQAQVDTGAPRFQVRIQFGKYTDGDRQVDCLQCGEPNLVITYEE